LLDNFGVEHVDEIPDQYLDWIERLPTFFLLPDFLLVHAGLNFKQAEPLQDYRSLLTIRGWYPDIDRDWLGGRVIVHGHTPTRYPSIRAQIANLDQIPAVNIDNGAVYPDELLGGLCALNLDTMELVRRERVPTDNAMQWYYYN
jgi:serine/threonine protein phosphatase 1